MHTVTFDARLDGNEPLIEAALRIGGADSINITARPGFSIAAEFRVADDGMPKLMMAICPLFEAFWTTR